MRPNGTLVVVECFRRAIRKNIDAAHCRKEEVPMEESIAVGVAWLLLIGFFAGRPLYVKVRERMSPKYAVARKVRLAAKAARAEVARKQARENEAGRLQQWATEHSDNSTAQAYLATLPANTKSADGVVADEDIEETLRKRQDDDDATQRRLQERRRKDAQYLQWALANPSNPTARRHLGEVLVEARRNAQYGPGQSQAAQTVADIEAALALAGNSQQ